VQHGLRTGEDEAAILELDPHKVRHRIAEAQHAVKERIAALRGRMTVPKLRP
jgi:hypothetical protein